MKRALLIFILVLLGCDKDEVESFTGTLVKQGICLNYVIQVNDVDFPQELVEKNWIDEFSEIEYENVFALKSVCDFPESINEGDSFNFIIDKEKENQCAVCLAFSPVPNKSVSITVID